jgi:hypothetical protein
LCLLLLHRDDHQYLFLLWLSCQGTRFSCHSSHVEETLGHWEDTVFHHLHFHGPLGLGIAEFTRLGTQCGIFQVDTRLRGLHPTTYEQFACRTFVFRW